MKKSTRRQYQKRLQRQLVENQKFLIKQLRENWERVQKEAKREQIVRQAREVGRIALTAVAKTILTIAGIGGILTVAVIAPNVFGAAGRLTKRNYYFNKNDFNKTKRHLKRQKYIRVNEENEFTKIELTDKGIERVLKMTFNDLKINQPQRWDGFWRIAIFDIPNRHKWAREGFRSKLKEIGFYQLQESVFIMPYSCEEEIKFLTSVFNLGGYVRLIRTRDLIPDGDVKKHFSLH